MTERIREQDRQLIELLNEYPYLMTQDVHEETGRHYRSTNRRLRELTERGYLERKPLFTDRLFRGYVYSLKRRGLLLARRRNFRSDKVALNMEKSGRMIPHEVELTRFHRALAATGMLTFWEQRRMFLMDDVRDSRERLTVNPDGFFAVTDEAKPEGENTQYFYLEIEKSRQAKYVNGESGLMRKVRAFFRYRESGRHERHWSRQGLEVADFRVIFVLATEDRALNFLVRMREDFPYRLFWVTWEDAYREDVAAAIFRTPRDYEERSYSLRD